MWCGDLNVAHKAIDLKNDKANYNKSAGYTQQEIDGMDNYHKSGFVDSFRHFYPEEEKYSWWSYRMNAREKECRLENRLFFDFAAIDPKD